MLRPAMSRCGKQLRQKHLLYRSFLFRPRLEQLEDRVLLDAGLLDTAFGNGGLVTSDFDGHFDRAWAVDVQSDGAIVAVGESTDALSATSRFAVARYLSDGSRDSSFGSNGQVTTNVGAGFMGAPRSGDSIGWQNRGCGPG